MDLRVEPTLVRFGLRHVRYLPTATFGHFGRPDDGVPWEDVALSTDLRRLSKVE